MNLGFSLRMSVALIQRQALEQSLSLNVVQNLQLVLALYIKREDQLTKLYRRALHRGKVLQYQKHGMTFEYALVPAKEVPDEIKANGNYAFSHCLYKALDEIFFGTKYALARGSWLLFVIEDLYPDIPEQFMTYAAVHERGEQVTLGDHNQASKLEFAIALKEHELTRYMDWIETNCSAKFADVFSYQTHLDLPDEEEFQQILEAQLATEEAERIRWMIQNFEWPVMLLRRLKLYQDKNEKAAAIVDQVFQVIEDMAGEVGAPLTQLVANARSMASSGLCRLIDRDLVRHLSRPRFNELWRERRIKADQLFSEMLHRRKQIKPDTYIEELIASGITDALPNDGVLSLRFDEALAAIKR